MAIKRRWQKAVLIVSVVLIVLVGIATLLFNQIASPILEKKIKSAVLKGSDSLYRIDFSDIELSLMQGKVVLYGAKLHIDSAVYHKQQKQGRAPNSLYTVNVNRLVLSHIHPFAYLFHKNANITRIAITSPKIDIDYYLNHKTDTVTTDNRTLYQKISKDLKLVHVGEILLDSVQLKYTDHTAATPAITRLKELNLKATDLLIDSATQTDCSRFLYCSDIVTELNNFSSRSKDGAYTFKVRSAKLSTKTSRVDVKGVSMLPNYPPSAFFDVHEGDRMSLQFATVQLNHFDFLSYHQYHVFNTAKVTLSQGKFSVFSNYKGAPKTTDRVVTFPQFLVKKVKAAFNIDTLIVKGTDVNYNALNKKSGKTGLVNFSNTSGRFLNITNNKDSLRKNAICKVALTTFFMGAGKLDLTFAFNLANPNYNYVYKGHLGPMEMQPVNQATMPLAMIKVTSGKVKSMDFDIHSTKTVSTGKVSLLYNDLKIEMLKPSDDKQYDKKVLLSFLANTFVIKHDNPDDGDIIPRTANVTFIRPYTFPFFKTLWQTLLSGIKPCAGVGKPKPEAPKPQLTGKQKKEEEKRLKKLAEEKQKVADQLNKDKEKAAKETKKQREKEAKSARSY